MVELEGSLRRQNLHQWSIVAEINIGTGAAVFSRNEVVERQEQNALRGLETRKFFATMKIYDEIQ
ncbi:MAG: hypothetical protein LBB34_01115 [Holosporales bacterium]|jgi:hypothetical protein|nr:hypothetical protein [Holosporales bacterium]